MVRASCRLIYLICELFLLVVDLTKSVPDTRGREFVFALFGDNVTDRWQLDVTPQSIRLNGQKQTMNISVNTPSHRNDAAERIVPMNQTSSLTMVLDNELYVGNEMISNKAILVKSDQDVSLTMQKTQGCESILLFPTDVFGTEYVVLTSEYTQGDKNTIAIVTTLNDTIVKLDGAMLRHAQLPDQAIETDSGYNLTLDAYSVLQISCLCDLTGIRTSSSEPIGLFVGVSLQSDIPKCKTTGWTMLPPTDTWGKTFVLVSPVAQTEITARILARSNASVDIYTTTSTRLQTLSSYVAAPINDVGKEYVYVQSSSPALVLQVTSHRDSFQIFVVPPVEQYLRDYAFSVNSSCNRSCFASISPFQNVQGFLLDGKRLPNPSKMISFNVSGKNYTIVQTHMSQGFHDLNHTDPTYSFCAYTNDNTSGYARWHPLGMRMAPLYDACIEQIQPYGGLGDGLDNDCDGKIDEEVYDFKDNDGDGLVDEDTVRDYDISAYPGAGTRLNFSSGEEPLDSAVVAVVVSLCVAVFAIGSFLGSFILHDFWVGRKEMRNTRVVPVP